jgi:hypothetical protein
MRSFRLGDIEHSSIAVKYQACQALQDWNVIPSKTCTDKDSTYTVEDVMLLWTLGDNPYFEFKSRIIEKEVDDEIIKDVKGNSIKKTKGNPICKEGKIRRTISKDQIVAIGNDVPEKNTSP